MLLRILLCSLYRPLLRSIQRILNLARKFGAAAFKNAGYLRALHVTAQRALEFQCNTRAWLDNGRITRLSNSKRSKAARAITTSRSKTCVPLKFQLRQLLLHRFDFLRIRGWGANSVDPVNCVSAV